MAVWSVIQKRCLYGSLRIDAEFYQENYLHVDKAIRSLEHTRLGSLLHTLYRYPTFYGFEFTNFGVPCLKGEDIETTGFVSSKSGDCVSSNIARRFPLTVLKKDDLVFSVRGYVGKVGLIGANLSGAQISPNLIRASVDRSKVDPLYLWTFLNCKYGKLQFDRFKMRTSQETILSSDIKNFAVALFPDNLQNMVRIVVEEALHKKTDAMGLYQEADTLLSSALGLYNVDFAPRLFYEDRFSRVATAKRFDAEYYQPAKWDVLRALAAMKGRPIGEHFRSVRQLWQPDRQPPTCEVRNYDLTDALSPFLDDTKPVTTASEISSTKKVLKPGDLVISRLRSYLKEISVVLPSSETPLVGSTEFIILRPCKTTISPEALLVFLRSPYVQTVLKWCQDGSNHPRFNEKEILTIPIPGTVQDIQDELKQKVKQVIIALQESRHLLETAKRAVEIAIEDGEAEARKFLDKAGR